jgi:hypothetical protein
MRMGNKLEVPTKFQYTDRVIRNNNTMTYKDLRDQLNKCSEEELNETIYLNDEFTEDVFTLEGEGTGVYLVLQDEDSDDE